jgi:hypothetical protein
LHGMRLAISESWLIIPPRKKLARIEEIFYLHSGIKIA